MDNKPGMSLDEIRAFLNGSDGVHFEGQQREEIYAWASPPIGNDPFVPLKLYRQVNEPAQSDFENRAVSRDSPTAGCPVQVPIIGSYQPTLGIISVKHREAMEGRQRAFRRKVKMVP